MVDLVESKNLPAVPTSSASSAGDDGRADEASSLFTGAVAPRALDTLPDDMERTGGPQAVSAESEKAFIGAFEHPHTGRDVRENHGPVPNFSEAALTASEEYRVKEANRRQEVLETFNSLVNGGMSKRSAALQVGESETTLWRWREAFKKSGFNGLLPNTDKCGRKTTLEKLGVTQAVVDQMRGIRLDTGSTTAAARLFAQSDRCPEELARVILDPNKSSKHALPPSLRRAINVSDAEDLAHRGPRALALKGAWTPRTVSDILPGDIFCADDTTPIFGWWVPWITSEDYPFGVKLLQGQLLPVIDVGSQKLLTFALIAREKSSYRATDIWGLFGHTFDKVGLPRLGFQLERGTWESNIISGADVAYQDGEVSMSRRVGGLRQLPTNITDWHRRTHGEDYPFGKTLQTWTSYLPKTKSIEAFFNRSQTLEATLWGTLGRDQMRRPFEKMKKLYQQCSRAGAKIDPRQHFLSQSELIARLNEIWRYINNEPMEGDVFSGRPDMKWDQWVTNTYPLMNLPEDMAWLYKRDWAETYVDGAHVRVRLTHPVSGERYSLFYTNPTVFARHDVAGQDVVIYYDREDFEQPAQILLARTGKYLCEANYFERTGSFLQGDRTGHDIRKQWKNTVMAGYGTIAKHAPSRQVPQEIKARREAAKLPQGNGGEPAPASRPVPQIPKVETPVRRSNVPLIID